VEAIIYTDIGRDGMLEGFNAEATRALAQAITTPVIASGGVSSLDDLRKLRELEPTAWPAASSAARCTRVGSSSPIA